MRSEIAKKISDETPQEVRDAVRAYGDSVVRKEELRKEFNKWKYPQYEIPVNVFDWFYRKLEAKDKEIDFQKRGFDFLYGQAKQEITDLKAEIERYKELILTLKMD